MTAINIPVKLDPPAHNFIDETGNTHGILTVLDFAYVRVQRPGHSRVFWEVQCLCGEVLIVHGTRLRNGSVTSCHRCKERFGKIVAVKNI